jgi:hypothetical protein
MTTLRDAAQQALEALLDDPNKLVQISEHHWESKRDLAVIALHAALAEPDKTEPLRRENERLQDMLYEQLGELTALRAEKQMRTRIEQLKEQPK